MCIFQKLKKNMCNRYYVAEDVGEMLIVERNEKNPSGKETEQCVTKETKKWICSAIYFPFSSANLPN